MLDQELLTRSGPSRRYKSGWSRAWNRKGHIPLFIQQRRSGCNYLRRDCARKAFDAAHDYTARKAVCAVARINTCYRIREKLLGGSAS
eukprot:5803-Heterococcus_DN1.PRE.3